MCPLLFSHAHLVVVGEVVAVLHALVAADDVEQLVVRQEAGGHVRPEEAREAARVGEPTGLVLESKVDGKTQHMPILKGPFIRPLSQREGTGS